MIPTGNAFLFGDVPPDRGEFHAPAVSGGKTEEMTAGTSTSPEVVPRRKSRSLLVLPFRVAFGEREIVKLKLK